MTRPRSLVFRLVLVQVTALAALWLVIIALSVAAIYQRDGGDIDVELRTLARSLAELAPSSGDASEAARIAGQLSRIQRDASDPPLSGDELALQLWAADGTELAHFGSLGALPPGPDSGVATRAGWYAQGMWNSSHTRFAVAAKKVSYYQRRAREMALGLSGLWLAFAAICAAVFWWSFRRVIRPVGSLAKRVADRAADDLSPVEENGAFVEIRPLLAALNEKLARLRGLLDAERQFFGDAAHELRTPLSVIGAQAHVLAHEPELSRRLDGLRQIEGGIERGARVISKLLTLGRLEGADGRLELARRDIARIASTVVDAHLTVAARRGLHLEFIGGDPVECDCNAGEIAVLLENLVENSLLYCPAGCNVRVNTTLDGGFAKIVVADDGPGIALADRERIFERFQRLDGTAAEGSGLGLAIVRRIAALHGGSALARTGLDGRGTAIEVRLPMHPVS